MKPKHCCDCAYWGGEPVGFWTALPNNMNWAAKARFRCSHPKHFKQPKCNYRKACKYFEQKEVKAIMIKGEYPADCHSERSEESRKHKDMTKKQRLEYVKKLLSNEYGVFGRERVDWQTLYFSESVIKKMGIEKGEGKTIMHEAYLSDTPSGVAVNNKFGDSIDFMELTEMEAFRVGQLVEWKRNRAYRDLC